MAQQGDAADHVVRLREALASLATAIGARVARARDALAAWRQAAAERRYLESLNDHGLRDLGLSRDDVQRDSTQSFWR